MTESARASGQQAIELILMRQLALHLSTPVFIVDALGALLYYNEAAERLLGRAYEENDEMPVTEWALGFRPRREDGQALRPEELPLTIALTQRRPGFLSPVRIMGSDDVERRIAILAFPLDGQQARNLGAVAIFWEV